MSQRNDASTRSGWLCGETHYFIQWIHYFIADSSSDSIFCWERLDSWWQHCSLCTGFIPPQNFPSPLLWKLGESEEEKKKEEIIIRNNDFLKWHKIQQRFSHDFDKVIVLTARLPQPVTWVFPRWRGVKFLLGNECAMISPMISWRYSFGWLFHN